ncbi:MAG: hypothetical protein ACRD4F_08120, partial [Candidatus Angelobacter sp.]
MATARVFARTPLEIRVVEEDGKVDQPEIILSRAAKEEVTWFAHGSHKAIIAFASPDGSPFHDTIFQVPAGGSVSSGPVKSTAQYKEYKYTVIGHCGVNDPK